jgi:hypothetical protein
MYGDMVPAFLEDGLKEKTPACVKYKPSSEVLGDEKYFCFKPLKDFMSKKKN